MASAQVDIVVFSGAYGQAYHYDHILEAAQSVFPGCLTHLFVVHDVVGDDWWAPYSPAASELLFYVRRGYSYKAALEAAETWTYRAEEHKLPDIMAQVPPLQEG